MERYNPFANEPQYADDLPATPIRSSVAPQAGNQRSSTFSTSSASPPPPPPPPPAPASSSHSALRYTTSFPDPFADSTNDAHHDDRDQTRPDQANDAPRDPVQPAAQYQARPLMQRTQTTAGSSGSASSARQSGTFTSFLSRATSVTSSTVTDRVSGAVGSVRSAVDSISSQIQQAVPSGFGSDAQLSGEGGQSSAPLQVSQQQQSAASYLAAKLSASSGSTAANQGGQQLPVICRQRVVLILDSLAGADWAQQFQAYRRLVSGASGGSTSGAGASSTLTSFFASQFSQLASSGSSQSDGDLIEQVNFRNISVLANQASSTAAIYVCGSSGAPPSSSSGSTASQLLFKSSSSSASSADTSGATKIIRPEFVIVRERCKDRALDHLRGVVKALGYSMVPMFEPYEIWDTFQDKQLIFSRLIRVRTKLGKENFPLIPQIYCQTHQDLLNYIANSQIRLPCLVRTGHLGKGKIKIDSIQMLKDFASIMATSGQSCTIEQYLDVKYDLVVQRLGTSLKLFRRIIQKPSNESFHQNAGGQSQSSNPSNGGFQFDDTLGAQKQTAVRQTSLGASVGVLSNLISGQQQQQPPPVSPSDRRRSSGLAGGGAGAYERLAEVSARYRNWVEAVAREFDNKLEVLCIKIVVASNDREYIVGLRNCSMDFLGNQENQDEDRRSFVELVLTRMNTILPKHSPISRESSLNQPRFPPASPYDRQPSPRRTSSGDDAYGPVLQKTLAGSSPAHLARVDGSGGTSAAAKSKPTFMSQSDINSAVGGRGLDNDFYSRSPTTHNYGQLNSRSKSVSINQAGDSFGSATPPAGANKSTPFNYATGSLPRRDSDSLEDEQFSATGGASHQRQASLGQSFLDQTTTAFSSFQKQSLSFLKRLDSTRSDQMFGSGGSGGGPPSPKYEVRFDRDYKGSGGLYGSGAPSSSKSNSGTKSQSMDSGTHLTDGQGRSPRRETPPKPPPPHSFVNRQSSLASYSTNQPPNRSSSAKRLSDVTTVTPNTTPTTSRQNSTALRDGSIERSAGETNRGAGQQDQPATNNRNRVVRQNSALSAFEPFDPDLRVSGLLDNEVQQQAPVGSHHSPVAKPRAAGSGGNIDTGSITSGDSASTNETTTAEDTMNNLKKTFASIFGDKCD